MKNIQKFILVVFFLLLYTNSQSQEKKAHLLFPVKKDVAIITLPDILVKRDTIIVTNDNKGSLKSTGSKIPATYFKDLKEYSFFFETFFDKDFSEEETIGRFWSIKSYQKNEKMATSNEKKKETYQNRRIFNDLFWYRGNAERKTIKKFYSNNKTLL